MAGMTVDPDEYLKGKITLAYELNNEKKIKVFPASNFHRDEDFVFYAFYEGETALTIRQCYIEPLDGKTLILGYFKFEKSFKYFNRTILSNGFASNTECREYYYTDKMNLSLPMFIRRKEILGGDYTIYKHENVKGSIYSHQFIGIGSSKKVDNDRYHIIANREIHNSYTIIKTDTNEDLLAFHTDLVGKKITEKEKVLDVITIINTEKYCFDKYFNELNITRKIPEPMIGWDYAACKGKKATPDYILENVRAIKEAKLDVGMVVIDYGYETAVGDWLYLTPAFKDNMKSMIDKIHEAGMKVAIKLDPLICEKNSILYKYHPKWILNSKNGKPYVVKINRWGEKNIYILDIYTKEYQDFLGNVFDTMIKWGVDVFWLGGLFTGGILPYDVWSRALTMDGTMKILNQLAKGKEIVVDEMPTSIAIDNCDYCCITPKATRNWVGDSYKAGVREKNSTANAISALILRRMFNNRAFSSVTYLCHLTKKHNELTDAQRDTLLQVAMVLGGLTLLSESINSLPKEDLKKMYSLFPKKKATIISAIEYVKNIFVCHFNLGLYEYYLLVNCSNEDAKINLPMHTFFCKENTQIYDQNRAITVLPYATKTLRVIGDSEILYGSTGYYVPCGEIISITEERSNTGHNIVKLNLEPDYKNKGSFYFKPNHIFELFVNGKKCNMVDFDGRYEKYIYEME